jgi:hypothetical protein
VARTGNRGKAGPILPEDPQHHIRRGLAAERALTRQHLVQHHAEREDVAARIRDATAYLPG